MPNLTMKSKIATKKDIHDSKERQEGHEVEGKDAIRDCDEVDTKGKNNEKQGRRERT